MTQIRTRDLRRGFLAKGLVEVAGGNHDLFHVVFEGRKTGVFTFVSRGIDVYGDQLLGKMARQLCLTRRELGDLVDCPLSRDRHLQILREAGRL